MDFLRSDLRGGGGWGFFFIFWKLTDAGPGRLDDYIKWIF